MGEKLLLERRRAPFASDNHTRETSHNFPGRERYVSLELKRLLGDTRTDGNIQNVGADNRNEHKGSSALVPDFTRRKREPTMKDRYGRK